MTDTSSMTASLMAVRDHANEQVEVTQDPISAMPPPATMAADLGGSIRQLLDLLHDQDRNEDLVDSQREFHWHLSLVQTLAGEALGDT
ncbi:MAG: hypothetical protein M3220_20405 [Chloroflexota bacterium]|nr:hypothetical protein [Chloroflexota bacterium]